MDEFFISGRGNKRPRLPESSVSSPSKARPSAQEAAADDCSAQGNIPLQRWCKQAGETPYSDGTTFLKPIV